MAASKMRVDWSLLLLRLAVGGLALVRGLATLRHAQAGSSLAHPVGLVIALVDLAGGGLVLVGLWTWLAAGLLAMAAAWPLVLGWSHGMGPLAEPAALSRLLATLACAVGGAGAWSLDRR